MTTAATEAAIRAAIATRIGTSGEELLLVPAVGLLTGFAAGELGATEASPGLL
jgi:hypothetical protein